MWGLPLCVIVSAEPWVYGKHTSIVSLWHGATNSGTLSWLSGLTIEYVRKRRLRGRHASAVTFPGTGCPYVYLIRRRKQSFQQNQKAVTHQTSTRGLFWGYNEYLLSTQFRFKFLLVYVYFTWWCQFYFKFRQNWEWKRHFVNLSQCRKF